MFEESNALKHQRLTSSYMMLYCIRKLFALFYVHALQIQEKLTTKTNFFSSFLISQS